MPDVREKLVELIAQKVCAVWSEACDERIPPDCGKCYANNCRIAEVADHLIANGVTIQRWIPVTERLPENEKDVLIRAERKLYGIGKRGSKIASVISMAFHTDGKMNTEQSAYTWETEYLDAEYDEEADAYIIPEGWWESVAYSEAFSAVCDVVTHWMPLPQPPKGE